MRAEGAVGRVSSVAYLGEVVLVPLGYVLAGVLAETLGAQVVLLVAFGGIAATTAALLLSRDLRELPDHPRSRRPSLG
ncbi:hypothetical protein [Pseudokineococcus sp. 1T1Z-3]|uniref:hypothetical protein n=1 Tax=Pseudokineococcus sp. 1T1Z-3 TaxID=3132745 RepID=UPI0030981829